MWELDHKEGWVIKNWCFWTMALEKTLESPLGCKASNQFDIQPVHPKGNQSWIFTGRTYAEAEAPILRPPDAKHWLTGRHWCWERLTAEGEGITADEMVGWHHQLDGPVFEQAPGVGDGWGSLACCSPWGCKKSTATATAKSLQSCPTLCDPIDGSPPGSSPFLHYLPDFAQIHVHWVGNAV